MYLVSCNIKRVCFHVLWRFYLPSIFYVTENRRASIDIFLKAAGYLDCAVRHILPHLPPELRLFDTGWCFAYCKVLLSYNFSFQEKSTGWLSWRIPTCSLSSSTGAGTNSSTICCIFLCIKNKGYFDQHRKWIFVVSRNRTR